MKFLIPLLISASAFAGDNHAHGPSGEIEHLWPILAVFAVIGIAGAAFHFVNKKKK